MNSINMVINSLNFKLERIIQLKGVLFCFVLLSAMPHSTQIFVPQPGRVLTTGPSGKFQRFCKYVCVCVCVCVCEVN